jgi:uncharacterized YigZ family protein
MSDYMIPAETTFYEQSIKRSRFLTWIYHSASPQIAKYHINAIQQQYPDARHICWAWIAGAPNTMHLAMNDDGEPSGTAGKPMLNVLQHKELGEITAVVVRYFGGIKLGTGGLSRAYSSSVSEALKITPLTARIEMQSIQIICAYCDENSVRYLLDKYIAQIISIDYQETVYWHCQLPSQHFSVFQQQLPFTVQCKAIT